MTTSTLFQHWNYGTFAPGALSRRKYLVFQLLMTLEAQCLERVAWLEALQYGTLYADWSCVERECAALESDVAAMVGLLRELHPLRWIDIAEYTAKVSFYARLAMSTPEPVFSPPYMLSVPFASLEGAEITEESQAKVSQETASRGITEEATVQKVTVQKVTAQDFACIITPASYHYIIEYNDLRQTLNAFLEKVHMVNSDELVEVCKAMQACIVEAKLPYEIETAILDASLSLSPDRAPLTLCAYTSGEEHFYSSDNVARTMASNKSLPDDAQVLYYQELIPKDVPQAYLVAMASKYTPEKVLTRIHEGRADSECAVLVSLTVQNIKKSSAPRFSPERSLPQPSLAKRITPAMRHVARLHITDDHESMEHTSSYFKPENCRSVHDIVRFCHTVSMRHMFDLMSESFPQNQGLGGARLVCTGLPIAMRVLNLGDGLFPSATGKARISPEDFHCLPIWALCFGFEMGKKNVLKAQEYSDALAEKESAKNTTKSKTRSSRKKISSLKKVKNTASCMTCNAVIAAHYVYAVCRFSHQTFIIESQCGGPKDEAFITLRLKTGHGSLAVNRERLDFCQGVLKNMGFSIQLHGGLLQAQCTKLGHGLDETQLQRHLATLGQMLAVSALPLDNQQTTAEAIDIFMKSGAIEATTYGH